MTVCADVVAEICPARSGRIDDMAELATLDLPGGVVVLRTATPEDLSTLVKLLADDELGVHRERVDATTLPKYRAALDEITADPAHLLVVAVIDRRVVGVLQFSVIPGLARQGARRAQIEGVRVDRDFRGGRVGAGMIEWAVTEARRRGCGLVQLTTDKNRRSAHRLYRRLGFKASHEGMKLQLA